MTATIGRPVRRDWLGFQPGFLDALNLPPRPDLDVLTDTGEAVVDVFVNMAKAGKKVADDLATALKPIAAMYATAGALIAGAIQQAAQKAVQQAWSYPVGQTPSGAPMMAQMPPDDPVPIPGPVYGWRTWVMKVSNEHLLSRGTTWRDPEQHAHCFSRLEDGEGQDPHDSHDPVTAPTCWCGLYAHISLEHCLSAGKKSQKIATRYLALGLVQSWGQMWVGDRGFRAQHQRIESLVCIKREGRHHNQLHLIAGELRVPIVCIDAVKDPDRHPNDIPNIVPSRAQLAAAFTDAPPTVFIWEKEVSWISDDDSDG